MNTVSLGFVWRVDIAGGGALQCGFRSEKTVYTVYTFITVSAKVKESAKSHAAKKSKPGKQVADVLATANPVKDKRPAKASGVAGETKQAKPAVIERVKLVRDSFTMPRDDFDLIAKLKSRALEFKRPTKKSELLRAGLQQLAALDEAQLRAALAALRPLQTGRPKKAR